MLADTVAALVCGTLLEVEITTTEEVSVVEESVRTIALVLVSTTAEVVASVIEVDVVVATSVEEEVVVGSTTTTAVLVVTSSTEVVDAFCLLANSTLAIETILEANNGFSA